MTAQRNARLGSLACAARRARDTQGRAHQFWRVFNASTVPMVMVDHDRRYTAANAAARLFFRLSLDELLARRIDDLTPPDRRDRLRTIWEQLISQGAVTGLYDFSFEDATAARISYCAIANALPSQHLLIFMPAHWGEDELGTTESDPGPATSPLAARELEVLTLIAAGGTTHEIARELTISPATVFTHVQNILTKLKARNRPHAVALAMQRRLIDPSTLERDARDLYAACAAESR